MGGFLVAGRRLGIPIDLDQQESGGIIGLLDDIEARDAGFPDTVAGVFDRGGPEGVGAFRLHFYLNMNDEHPVCLAGVTVGGKPVNEVMDGTSGASSARRRLCSA